MQTTTAMETDVFWRNRLASARNSCLSCSTAGSASTRGAVGEVPKTDPPESSANRFVLSFLALLGLEWLAGFAAPGVWWSGSFPFGPCASSQSGSRSIWSDVQQWLCHTGIGKTPRRRERGKTLGIRPCGPSRTREGSAEIAAQRDPLRQFFPNGRKKMSHAGGAWTWRVDRF